MASYSIHCPLWPMDSLGFGLARGSYAGLSVHETWFHSWGEPVTLQLSKPLPTCLLSWIPSVGTLGPEAVHRLRREASGLQGCLTGTHDTCKPQPQSSCLRTLIGESRQNLNSLYPCTWCRARFCTALVASLTSDVGVSTAEPESTGCLRFTCFGTQGRQAKLT